MILFRFPATSTGRNVLTSIYRNLSQSAVPITREVLPFSNIKITSNYHLNIKPYDVHECPDGNLLRISLEPKIGNETCEKVAKVIANFDATVQVDDKNIEIDTVDKLGHQGNSEELANAVMCTIEVPVQANLKVNGKRDVSIQNMFSDVIEVTTNDGDVTTKNIQSAELTLTALNGHIRCDGCTLAHKMNIQSHGDKNIHLHKTLGDSLTAISENGIISTDSCYSENSKFVTKNGGLHLKNVHKKSELHLLDGGDLDVTGFHGTLNATTNGGTLNFQLTEVYGDSCIEAQGPEAFKVNISDFVEQHTCLAIDANKILIDSTLDHFEKCDNNGGSGDKLQSGNRDLTEDSLTIRTNGDLELGKLSWMDTIKQKMSQNTRDHE